MLKGTFLGAPCLFSLLALMGGMLGLLAGCAPAPPRPPVVTLPPPPPPSLTSREAALEKAMAEFYRAPYRQGGVTPGGVDCSGLVLAVFQRVGLALPRTVEEQYKVGQPVARNHLRFGDVVFFNRYCQAKKSGPYVASLWPPGYLSQVCHNGIYLGNGRFLHASPRGVEVASLDAEVWRLSFAGARRYLASEPTGGT
jgi:cell wall-associated NlpC family hydrolase